MHNFVGVRLQPKRDCRQGICQQIDEQQVNCRKGYRQPQQGSVKHRQYSGCITGQQKLNGSFDVCIHVSSVFYSFYDCGEVIVRQHHVGGILGNLRSGNAHCNADVCLLQSGSIVDAVTGHSNKIAAMLPRPNNSDFMLGGYSGINADLRNKALKLFIAHFINNCAFNGFRPVMQNPYFPRNSRRSDFMIACNHNGTDPGADTLRHRRF